MAEAIETRGIPPLRGSSGMSSKLRIMVVAVAVLVVLVLVSLVVYSRVKAARSEAADDSLALPQQAATENRDTDLATPPTFVQDALSSRAGASPEDASASDDAAALAAPPALLGIANGAPQELSEAEAAELDRRERRQRAPVLAFSRGSAPGAGAGREDPAPAAAAAPEDPYGLALMTALGAGNAPAPAPAGSDLSTRLESDKHAPATASRATNPSFIVPQGTIGRCVMRTAFNSQLSGFSSCTLSDPIYSADGRFIMAEQGSEIIGTYQTGEIGPGAARAFVLWDRIRTPTGVVIDLGSPATDSQGRSGITGKVNNHFWKRFGAGLLLSLVDDTVSQARGSNSDYRATSESMNNAAAIAVENSVNIPPTISVKAGAIVNIFVARDLDFSSVYSARLAGDAGGR